MNTPLPVHTEDTTLAIALHVCGIPPMRIENRYTVAAMLGFGFGMDDLKRDFPACIGEAKRMNRMGKVIYFYEPTPELEEAKRAWFDQRAINERGEQGQEIGDATGDLVMRVAACIFGVRKFYVEAWKQCPGHFWKPNIGERQVTPQHATLASGQKVEVGRTETLPGFVLIPANLPNAAEEIRKHL